MNPKFIVVEGEESVQGSDAWKAFRKDKIGASDIATILGVNPWETPLEFFIRKIHGIELPKNEAMQRGNDLEKEARRLVNEMTGKNYQPCVLQSSENPYLMVSLDGMYIDDSGVHIIEIKCPGKKTHEVAKGGEIPLYYIPQICYQCMLTGPKTALYISWDGTSKEPVIIDYEPNLDLFHEIKVKVNEFLQDLKDFKVSNA